MGYSCTQDADYTLGVIRKAYGDPATGNVLILRGERYFYERGRENDDGAITGKLWRMLPDDGATVAGTFRIASDGTIDRFPRLSSVQKREIENTFRDMQARNPQLLRAWSMGVL